jgi:hypothetical protein
VALRCSCKREEEGECACQQALLHAPMVRLRS